MNKKDLTKSVLDKIEQDTLAPVPKWRFVFKNLLFWSFSILSLLIIIAVTSVIFLNLYQMDIAVAGQASGGLLRHIILFIPFSLFLVVGLFVFLAFKNFLNTKYGYKHSHLLVLFSIVVVGIFSGWLMHSAGLSEKTEYYTDSLTGGRHHGAQFRRRQMWTQPEKGLLAGVALGTVNGQEDSFSLIDFTGKTWLIDARRLESKDKLILKISPQISIIGKQRSPTEFEAYKVEPWSKAIHPRVRRPATQKSIPRH